MSWIVNFFFGLLLSPIIIVGYIEIVKKNQEKEIKELVEMIETKLNKTEKDFLFINSAKDFLNNLEKND